MNLLLLLLCFFVVSALIDGVFVLIFGTGTLIVGGAVYDVVQLSWILV